MAGAPPGSAQWLEHRIEEERDEQSRLGQKRAELERRVVEAEQLRHKVTALLRDRRRSP